MAGAALSVSVLEKNSLAQELVSAAGTPAPVAIPLGLGPLMALMRRAKFVVSADTGPLHLASALGTPVVGLYGPTDPARNGPYGGPKPNPKYCHPQSQQERNDLPPRRVLFFAHAFDHR